MKRKKISNELAIVTDFLRLHIQQTAKNRRGPLGVEVVDTLVMCIYCANFKNVDFG
jgi:hypothetical protein